MTYSKRIEKVRCELALLAGNIDPKTWILVRDIRNELSCVAEGVHNLEERACLKIGQLFLPMGNNNEYKNKIGGNHDEDN